MYYLKIIGVISMLMLARRCPSSMLNSSPLGLGTSTNETTSQSKGKLFIIGGGKRSPELIRELLKTANFNESSYMVILPMASQEPDSAIYYASKQFIDIGINPKKIRGFNFEKGHVNLQWSDSLKKANLIYISGGDQTLFMDVVLKSPIYEALHEAYQNGSTIAGTSAGAAVMSKYMITGNQHKYPEYTGEFNTIESDNIEIAEGMGFLKHAIVDQHFIKRMRMNRLTTIAIEYPDQTAIGIDESTAIIVEGNSARIVGDSQVIIIKNPHKINHKKNGLLGADALELSVKLPGSKFNLQ